MNIVLVFEQHAERIVDVFFRQLDHVKRGEGARPVNRLSDSGQLEHVLFAYALHKGHDLRGQALIDARHFAPHDLKLTRGVRIVHPVIQTAPLDRIMNFTRAIRRDHDERRIRGGDRP